MTDSSVTTTGLNPNTDNSTNGVAAKMSELETVGESTVVDLEKSVKALVLIVKHLNVKIVDQADELKRTKARLEESEGRLTAFDKRLDLGLAEEVADIKESIRKATEFSMDCISEAAAEGLHKISLLASDHSSPSKINSDSSSINGNMGKPKEDVLVFATNEDYSDEEDYNSVGSEDSAVHTPISSGHYDNCSIEQKFYTPKRTARDQCDNGDNSFDNDESNDHFVFEDNDLSQASYTELTKLDITSKTVQTSNKSDNQRKGIMSKNGKANMSTVRFDNTTNHSKPGILMNNREIFVGNVSYDADNWTLSDSMRRRTMNNSFKELSSFEQFKSRIQGDEAPTYPADSYSFLALYSPFDKPQYFFFGLSVFLFQMLFIIYLILGGIDPSTDFNNPGPIKFIPPNVSVLVRVTQITAVFSYLYFADEALRDCVRAVELWPRFDRQHGKLSLERAVFSSALRFTQGFCATMAALLLIVASKDVIEIILNFTALNFISSFDEMAFSLAKWGKYGPGLEKEAKDMETRKLPHCLYRKHKHIRYMYTVIPIGMIMILLLLVVILCQEHNKSWETGVFRIQLNDASLEDYSGCYEKSNIPVKGERRKFYNTHRNETQATIGYCESNLTWVLFKNDGTNNPCNRKTTIAHSDTTEEYDVSETFSMIWHSVSGSSIDLTFIELEYLEDPIAGCRAFLNDGKCDETFNSLEFNFDGGDCCAATCTKSNCGEGGANGAFGSDKSHIGYGYSDCIDDTMTSVTIFIHSISSSRDRNILTVTKDQEDEYRRERNISFWDEPPVSPDFAVQCDQNDVLWTQIEDAMEQKYEIIKIKEGSRCSIAVSNMTTDNGGWDAEPIRWVNYTIYHGSGASDPIVSVFSGVESSVTFQHIPDCYFAMLENHVSKSMVYSTNTDVSMALNWLVQSNSNLAKCSNHFLMERFALVAMNFASVANPSLEMFDNENIWISEKRHCQWENILCNDEGSVNSFALRDRNLVGSISTTIGLLTELMRFRYDRHSLTGTIPSELGKLTKLKHLDIDGNRLVGTIPTELGRLVEMQELDLDTNSLTGTFPTELGEMKELRDIDIKTNDISGPVPSEVGNLKQLVTIYFEENKFSGSLPVEMMTIKPLEHLHLHANNFTGLVPTEIGQLRSLKQIYLQNNTFSGSLPTEIGKLTNLQLLDLRSNNFTGSIPTEIGLMTSLDTVNLCGNSFTGQIPTEIGLLTKLNQLRLENNNFSGIIPLQVIALDQLQKKFLAGCD